MTCFPFLFTRNLDTSPKLSSDIDEGNLQWIEYILIIFLKCSFLTLYILLTCLLKGRV